MNELDIPDNADRIKVGVRPDRAYRYIDVIDVSGSLIETHEYYIGSEGGNDD